MEDYNIMRILIKHAEASLIHDEFPSCYFSAIVRENKIVCMCRNTNKACYDPTAHAEINAIRKTTRKLKQRHLEDCVLYSIFEPCPMCFSAIWWAKIPRIVYGAPISKVVGIRREINVSSSLLNNSSGNKIEITGGVLVDEALAILKKLHLEQ